MKPAGLGRVINSLDALENKNPRSKLQSILNNQIGSHSMMPHWPPVRAFSANCAKLSCG